jgi:hypothetical protein
MLVCPVRGCGQPLAWGEREATCPRRHRFDVARSGYLNLLQPQDRKSTEAGDSKEAVAARRRSMERGLGEALLAGLIEAAAGWKPAATPVMAQPQLLSSSGVPVSSGVSVSPPRSSSIWPSQSSSTSLSSSVAPGRTSPSASSQSPPSSVTPSPSSS